MRQMKTTHNIEGGHAFDRIYRGRVVASVIPDDHFAELYRVRLRDGFISDVTNLTRAKDAALSLASVGAL